MKDAEKQKKADKDPYARKPHDTDHAEWVNALCRNRGFQQMPVRGRTRCRIVATLYAITHNLIHQGNVRAAVANGAN